MISPERWPAVADWFDAALERPAGERCAWIRTACEDPDIRAAALRLLRAYQDSDDFLERPALDVVAENAVDVSLDGKARRHVGVYRLIRIIGHGGMGRVYLAERSDGHFEQQVALKLLRREAYSEQFLRSFLDERQILASLNHPHIARLFDGGMTDEGTPYFVMEYVDGEPIDAYCQARDGSIHERLALFQQVGSAVQYAHQNLVVHRDLKPSNILVTDDGTVKLLDFGIARLVDQESPASTPTRTARRWMTPGYASPEQVRGEAISTTSDVYQLGVVLYELLTGERPFNVRDKRPSEVERIICEAVPEPPSSVTGIARARRNALRGDLDTIVLKALRKEPERRYSSVEALVGDLKRHLAGVPVTARPDTWRYRSRKFVRRHRTIVLMAVATFLVTIGLGIVYTYQITQERNRAQQEAQKSARVTAFMTELLQGFDPNTSSGGTISAEAVLDEAVTRLQDELSDQPAVQAQLLRQIGQIHQGYGRYERARALLTQALEQRRALYGANHANVAESMMDMAWLLRVQGEYDAAETYYRRALTLRRKLFGTRHADVAASLEGLGHVRHVQGHPAEAEELLREALRLRRQLLPAQHPELAANLSSLAYVLYTRYQYDEAERLFRKALAIRRATLGTHVHVAETLHGLAAVLVAVQQDEEGETLYRQALAIRRDLLGDTHPQVAQSLSHLALLLERRGEYKQAERHFREALSVRRRHFGDKHVTVANSLNLLGGVHAKQGVFDRGEAELRQAVALYRELLGPDHAYVASGLRKLGALLTAEERYAEAEVAFQDALAIVRARFSVPHPQIANVLVGMGELRLRQGRPNDAEPLLREGHAMRREVLGAENRQTVEAQMQLGACLTALRRFDAAEERLLASLTTIRQDTTMAPAYWHRVREHLAALYTAWERPDQAARYGSMQVPVGPR